MQLDGTAIGVNCQINESLFVVDASKISMDDGIIRRQIQCSQICGDSTKCYIIDAKYYIKKLFKSNTRMRRINLILVLNVFQTCWYVIIELEIFEMPTAW